MLQYMGFKENPGVTLCVVCNDILLIAVWLLHALQACSVVYYSDTTAVEFVPGYRQSVISTLADLVLLSVTRRTLVSHLPLLCPEMG